MVERMVENYQNNRPDRNSNIDQNNQGTIEGENGRPNGQNEGLNENQNNDQNNVRRNETNDINISICHDHNLEYTVCKLTFLVCWFEINNLTFQFVLHIDAAIVINVHLTEEILTVTPYL